MSKPNVPHEFLEKLKTLYDDYFLFQEALAEDNFKSAQKALKAMNKSLVNVDMKLLQGDLHVAWMRLAEDLRNSLTSANEAKDIGVMRTVVLNRIAKVILLTEKLFGHIGSETYYQAFCPMAMDDDGASWLQRSELINNPYYGEMMLRCGEVEQTFLPRVKE